MELINRYIYAVTKDLPAKQREDISNELSGIIEDMLENYNGPETYEEKIKKVLTDLGNPEILSNNYRSTSRFLIGPKNFDSYIMVLKIVFVAVFVGISIATALGGLFSNEGNALKTILQYIASVFAALSQAFAWVTISFAIAEYYQMPTVSFNTTHEIWSLEDLPHIPKKEAKISRIESIVGIIFSSIFMSIIYLYPKFFAVYIPTPTGTNIIPIFDTSTVESFKLIIAILFLLSIAKEIIKLVAGRWNLKVAISTSVLSIITLILSLVLFTNPNIWNQNLVEDVVKYVDLGFDLAKAQSLFFKSFIAIIVIASLGEIVGSLYKGIKYNNLKM